MGGPELLSGGLDQPLDRMLGQIIARGAGGVIVINILVAKGLDRRRLLRCCCWRNAGVWSWYDRPLVRIWRIEDEEQNNQGRQAREKGKPSSFHASWNTDARPEELIAGISLSGAGEYFFFCLDIYLSESQKEKFWLGRREKETRRAKRTEAQGDDDVESRQEKA